MRFLVTKASDMSWPRKRKPLELNTLEELVEFIKKCGHNVIVDGCSDPPEIEIYDAYVE